MSRGPGKIELGVLDALARHSRNTASIQAEQVAAAAKRRWPKKRLAEMHRNERAALDAISIAQLVFRSFTLTKAQLGSVRRAIRRLAARGTLVEDPDPTVQVGKRTSWLLATDDGAAVTPISMTRRNTRQASRG